MSADKKCKVLITGEGSFHVLESKLQKLNKSKAGPFDICFCVGTMTMNQDNDSIDMPIPVYIMSSTKQQQQDENEIELFDDDDDDNNETPDNNDKKKRKKNSNIFYLDSNVADIVDITCGKDKSLVLKVAYIPLGARDGTVSNAWKQQLLLEENNNHNNKCDLLLSHDWGQGLVGSDGGDNHNKISCFPSAVDLSGFNEESGCYDVAVLAQQCLPRYHFSKHESLCYTSLPYSSSNNNNNNNNNAVTRFIALAPLPASPTQKISKSQKCIHALGLQPILSSPPTQQQQQQQAQVPCPYDTPIQSNNNNNHNMMSIPPPPPPPPPQWSMNSSYIPLHPPPPPPPPPHFNGSNSAYSYFGNQVGNHQKRKHGNDDPVDVTNVTLFLHGLHKDVSGGLSADSNGDNLLIRKFFEPYNCVNVRYPSRDRRNRPASFCFIDFSSHSQAAQCLHQMAGNVFISGISLTLKWSSKKNSNNILSSQLQPPAKKAKQRITEAEAQDSSSLFVRVPRFNKMQTKDKENTNIDSNNDGSSGIDVGNTMQDWLEFMRSSAQSSLEDAMNGSTGDESNNNEVVDKVTAETEPALKVELREMKDKNNLNYGFLDFASHAAASMAIATLTGSMDGGNITKKEFLPFPSPDWQMYWAKRKPPNTPKSNIDNRTNCWFCLSSPTCEKQLIVSILKDVYVTMPKGPLHDHHALVLPINHESDGIWNSPSVVEIVQTIQKLAQHAKEVLKSDLFIFERAIATRGGYHSHIQCIPIPPSVSNQLSDKLLSQMANNANFSLEEIIPPKIASDDDNGIQSMVSLIQKELQTPQLGDSRRNGNNSASATTTIDDEEGGNNEMRKKDHSEENEDSSDNKVLGYFYAQIIMNHNTEETAKKEMASSRHFLYKHVDKDKFIPLQFGREVVATALDNHELGDWKNCVKTNEEEKIITEQFRKSFTKYEKL